MMLMIIFISIVCLLYKILTSIYYLWVQKELKHADLLGFKKLLGTEFEYKSILNGTRRCRWTNIFIVVKASFDEDGKLTTSHTQPNHFLKQFLNYRYRLNLE